MYGPGEWKSRQILLIEICYVTASNYIVALCMFLSLSVLTVTNEPLKLAVQYEDGSQPTCMSGTIFHFYINSRKLGKESYHTDYQTNLKATKSVREK